MQHYPTHPQVTPLISMVIPMYNEADGLEILFSNLVPVLNDITAEWEIICIDDGSGDDTARRIAHIHQHEPRIKLVKLSRNFGKETALTAGLFHTSGQVVIPIDADLQDPPQLIPEMLEAWRGGAKVVLATRRERTGDGYLKRLTARWFYRLIGRMSRTSIPENTGDFRLMDRVVVEAVKRLPERTRFMKGVLSWVGFPTVQVYYDRPHRAVGESRFNFRSLWNLAMDGIFSFTTLPLQVWTYLGAFISILSFGYAIFLSIRTMISGSDVPGYASLMVAVLFMGGIQLTSLGVIGEYVGRIYRETKRRPLFIVEETVGCELRHADD